MKELNAKLYTLLKELAVLWEDIAEAASKAKREEENEKQKY